MLERSYQGISNSSGSFGTPVHWRNNGLNEIVVASNGRLKGFDLKTGKERWLVENVTGYVCTTPVVADGILFFAAWSNDTADSPLPTWEEFCKKNDKNGDGGVAFSEIDEASINIGYNHGGINRGASYG